MLDIGWWSSVYFWQEAKDLIVLRSPINNGALHVLAGSIIFAIAVFTSRRKRRCLLGWFAVLALAFWNEVVDLMIERWPDLTQQVREGVFDIALTMSVPSVILLSAVIAQVDGRSEAEDA